MMSNDRLSGIARRLLAARRQDARIALTGPNLPMDYEEGFAIQDMVVGALGSPIIGWKVMVLPAGPVLFAPILQSGSIAPGGVWTVAGGEPAGIELEIAFQMGRDVPAGSRGEQLLEAVESAHVGLELCQSRIADPAPRHVMLADCIANAGIVLGPQIADWRTRELRAIGGRLLVDDRVHAEGKSADPIAALTQLPRALGLRGKHLAAGHIVITGSLIGL